MDRRPSGAFPTVLHSFPTLEEALPKPPEFPEKQGEVEVLAELLSDPSQGEPD